MLPPLQPQSIAQNTFRNAPEAGLVDFPFLILEGNGEAVVVSVFDLLSIGVGPSSSHTVGPMRAAANFAQQLRENCVLESVKAVSVDLYGSLAATGHGHGTLTGVAAGLAGIRPETAIPEQLDELRAWIIAQGTILLDGTHAVPFSFDSIRLRSLTVLKRHTNGMTFTALDSVGEYANVLAQDTSFSIGGGFVVKDGEDEQPEGQTQLPYPFGSGEDLLRACEESGQPISAVMLANEKSLCSEDEIRHRLLEINAVMAACIRAGTSRSGLLPGGLNVPRRAKTWWEKLDAEDPNRDPVYALDWVNVVAMAVNEENASGGRMVTAPTNGAAGIIPAVLYYAENYVLPRTASLGERNDMAVRFFLTAGAIGSLYKERASISGAEVGCQGEVGSAASMAAGALAEIMGGTPAQVENAAEIAMEHNLGLTCDPIGGLVQIPCIERNAIAANKAINAARMALRGDGTHMVSLDQVIETMRQTGADMSYKYKETSLAGLAVNVPLC